jgi:predicted O-methyltransferase YrrM
VQPYNITTSPGQEVNLAFLCFLNSLVDILPQLTIKAPSGSREEMEGAAFDAADKYDSNSSLQREDGLYLMEKLALERGSKILDLGCGTGYLTKILADRVGPEGKVGCS